MTVGRKPLIVLELDLDFCSNTYGNALTSPQTGTCTASGAVGTECYNTRVTCQDPDNYIKGTKTYRFCEQNADVISGEAGIPALIGIPDCAPAKITSGKGLGDRASIKFKLQDFPHHDRGIDPYVSTRNYVPEEQGTFIGKLLKRNPYFIGRTARAKLGYITDPFDLGTFNSCEYILDRIDGPDKNYQYSIVAKDILKLTDDDKAQCPKVSTGKLLSNLGGFDTSPIPVTFTVIDSNLFIYSGEFNTSDQDTVLREVDFNDDGTIMYTAGTANSIISIIYQYGLSTPWDVTTADYSSNSPQKSFHVSQELFIFGFSFKTDGTKLYIIGQGSDTVYQYELSIAWDISTASYSANSPQKNFDASLQVTLPNALAFKSDGLKMYILSQKNGIVSPITPAIIHEYNLSVAWDVSTASYSSKSFDLSEQGDGATGISFNDNGSILYVSMSESRGIFQYNLSTSWDISTSSYSSKVFYTSEIQITISGLYFRSNNNAFYITDLNTDKIHQYFFDEKLYNQSNGRVRINDELIDYTTGTIDDFDTFTFNTLTRGIGGTSIESHNQDDVVQKCKVYTDENVTDILYDLLVNFADIPSNYIPLTEWDNEKDLWLAGNNLSVTLSEPEGVIELINELTEQNLVDIWWDITQQKIRIKSISPEHLNTTLPIYDEEKHLIEDSISAKKDDKNRLTQVWVYYGKRILTEDDKPEFYRYLFVSQDSDSESINKYDSKRVKKFISRWIQSESIAGKLANRLLNRYRNGVQQIEFQIDQKDQDISLGESIQIDTRSVQSEDGSNDIKTYQVTFSDFFRPGSIIKLQCVELDFYGNYIFIAPFPSPEIPDYSSATDEQKETMFFIAPDSGVFDDGTPAYKII